MSLVDSAASAPAAPHLGADGLDFHPGLRVAYVEYCKLPVGQGRMAFDAAAPKMSATQFIKLMQDVGVAEPEGHMPISTVSIIFTSFKPLGASRMLFPHFYRALGAIGSEAKLDTHRLVANLGSRVVDLQYLTSIKVFPDKAFPYILTRGASATDVAASQDGPPAAAMPACVSQEDASLALAQQQQASAGALGGGSPAASFVGGWPKPHGAVSSASALRASHIAKYAVVPFTGQGLVGKEASSTALAQHAQQQLTPRTQWRAEHFISAAAHAQGVQPGPDSPTNIGVTVYHVGLGGAGGGGGGDKAGSHANSGAQVELGSPRRTWVESDGASVPPNHHHMEQWGVWEPPKGPDGKVPSWISHLFDRMERLEGEVSELRKQVASSPAGGQPAPPSSVTVALKGFVTHEELCLHLQKAQDELRRAATAAAANGGGAEAAVQRALDEVVHPILARCTALEERVAKAERRAQVQAEKAEEDLQRLVGAMAAGSERLAGVVEQGLPALEGAVAEVATQVLELQTRAESGAASQGLVEQVQELHRWVDQGLASGEALRAIQAQLQRLADDSAVDRQQLLTTTNLLDTLSSKIAELESKALESQHTSAPVSDGGVAPEDLTELLNVLRSDLTTSAQEAVDAARRDAVARADAMDAAHADGLLALQRAVDVLVATDASRKHALEHLEAEGRARAGDMRDLMGLLRNAQEHADSVRAEAMARLESAEKSRMADLQALQARVSALQDELHAKALAGADAASASAIVDLQKALRDELDQNVARIAEEAATDRSQLVSTNQLVSQVLQTVEQVKADTEAGKQQLERLAALEVRVADLADKVVSSGSLSTAVSMRRISQRTDRPLSGNGQILQGGDFEQVLDLVSALEEKMNTLDRMVKGNTSGLTSMESTQATALARIAVLEAGGSGDGGSGGSDGAGGADGAAGLEGGAASANSAFTKRVDDALSQVGITPKAWQDMTAKASAIAEVEKVCKDVQNDAIKVKVSFVALNELLDNHAQRLEHLEVGSDNLKAGLERIRIMELNEKMKLLNSGTRPDDDTVASQAELSALSEKVVNIENTLVQTLLRMDSNIAQTAARAIRGEVAAGSSVLLAKSGVLAADAPGSRGANMPIGGTGEVRPSNSLNGGNNGGNNGSIIAADGHVAGGTTGRNAVAALNPHRDKLAAAILETDGKVAQVDEAVKTLKAGQDTLKGRIKELAEALVALSTKAQVRLTRLESGSRRSEMGTGEEDKAPADKRASTPGVSAAHKALDQASSQVTAMNRMLAKRLDELEERINKVAAAAGGRVPRLEGAPEVPHASLEDDVRGLGQDVVALHGMLLKAEAALRQSIAEECISRADMAMLQQALEANLGQKEEAILQKLAQQINNLAGAARF